MLGCSPADQESIYRSKNAAQSDPHGLLHVRAPPRRTYGPGPTSYRAQIADLPLEGCQTRKNTFYRCRALLLSLASMR